MPPSVLQTMDPVELSFGEALLKDAGIGVERTDPQLLTASSVPETVPGRLIVEEADFSLAVSLLREGLNRP